MEMSALLPASLLHGEQTPYSVEGILGLRASQDDVERRNISYTFWESNPVQTVGVCEEK
jgi:hypothetical protein